MSHISLLLCALKDWSISLSLLCSPSLSHLVALGAWIDQSESGKREDRSFLSPFPLYAPSPVHCYLEYEYILWNDDVDYR